MALCLTAAIGASRKPEHSVLMVYNKETEVINEFRSGMSDIVDVSVVDTASLAASSCDHSEWIVAVGKSAIDRSIGLCPKSNILIVETRFNIDEHFSNQQENVHSVYINQRPKRVIEDLTRYVPSIRSVGIAVSSKEEEVRYKSELEGSTIDIRYAIIEENSNPSIALNDMLGKVDALMVDDNEDIWRAGFIKAFLLASVRRGKVLVGGVNPQFIRAGVFAGSYTDMSSLGISVANKIKDQKTLPQKLGFHPKANFSYNELLAKRLNIVVMP